MLGVERTINWWDVPFDSRLVRVESKGYGYLKRVWCGMPKIPEALIRSTFFLYASREDALSGVGSGGTGFVVARPSLAAPEKVHTYAVTNWHVAVQGGFSVIRLNAVGGGVHILEYGPEDWIFEPYSYDIAILPIPVDPERTPAVAIHEGFFLTDENLARHDVGPGEDVFMVGRFIDFDGGETNRPTLRFGNISSMPVELRQASNGAIRPTYLIDLHSRTGYSGSPVFAYRTLGQDLTAEGINLGGNSQFLGFLGVHWGQFPEMWEIKGDADIPVVTDAAVRKNGRYIEGMSGMTCVAPASAILALMKGDKAERIYQATERLISNNNVTLASLDIKPTNYCSLDLDPNFSAARSSLPPPSAGGGD